MGKKSRLKQERRTALNASFGSEKIIQLTPEQMDLIKEQKEKFIKTFGREPRGDEPLFFDPRYTDKPTQIDSQEFEKQLINFLEEENTPQDVIYAVKKTGRIVTPENRKHLNPSELAEWDEAIQEYKKIN